MRSEMTHPRFPLGEYIRRNAGLPHDLAQSGMRGEIRSVRAPLRRPPLPDPEELARRIARRHGVVPERVFLTHGATEANTLVLLHLARRHAGRAGGRPRVRVRLPEYPPLLDTARFAGFRTISEVGEVELTLLSNPSNPEGMLLPSESVRALAERSRELLVDETFREFTSAPPLHDGGSAELWLTGTFTKAFGADDLRVGYAIAPEGQVESFRSVSWLLDGIPPPSISGALALDRHRPRILREVRERFVRNRRALVEVEPSAATIAAPVWFDRNVGTLGGDRLARAALRRGVLVCPGRFFGDPNGVRVCLTRSTFPADFAAYREVKAKLGLLR
ncbi:MAG: pyridoxal phosphate-dependent aminotransferase [Thermoplasmata archaeon]|nr:pyridoxal phosphate-dependent aminotransferase [Thermoplasmata archaeon]